MRGRRGRAGGYIKDAGYLGYARETGTQVSGIVHSGDLIFVWSYGPPFGGWANPSLIGRGEPTSIEYFDDPQPDEPNTIEAEAEPPQLSCIPGATWL